MADWLEINAIIDPDKSSSFADLESALKPFSDDSVIRRMIEHVYQELTNRTLYPIYPFELQTQARLLKYKLTTSHNWTYLLCLLLSYIGPHDGAFKLKAWKQSDITQMFEKVCTLASREYANNSLSSSQALQFGDPRKEWAFGPRGYSDALRHVAKCIHELTPKGPEGSDKGDRGLDIIAWRRFPDNRHGNLILLGQCSSSKECYADKSKLNELDNFIQDHADIHGQYLKMYFFPHAISQADASQNEQWRIMSRRAIPFDRLRICMYARVWPGDGLLASLKKILSRLKAYRHSL